MAVDPLNVLPRFPIPLPLFSMKGKRKKERAQVPSGDPNAEEPAERPKKREMNAFRGTRTLGK